MENNFLPPVTKDDLPPNPLLLPGLFAIGFTPPPGFTFEHWQGYMCFVRTVGNAIDWWLGDMLMWADQQGKEVEEAAIQYAHELGFADQTCANTKSLAKRYPLHTRFGALTPSHHNMVRGLEESERMKLLEQAQAEHWSVSQLKAARGGLSPAGSKNGKAEEPEAFDDNCICDCQWNESHDHVIAEHRVWEKGYGVALRKAIEILKANAQAMYTISLIEAELAKTIA